SIASWSYPHSRARRRPARPRSPDARRPPTAPFAAFAIRCATDARGTVRQSFSLVSRTTRDILCGRGRNETEARLFAKRLFAKSLFAEQWLTEPGRCPL